MAYLLDTLYIITFPTFNHMDEDLSNILKQGNCVSYHEKSFLVDKLLYEVKHLSCGRSIILSETWDHVELD